MTVITDDAPEDAVDAQENAGDAASNRPPKPAHDPLSEPATRPRPAAVVLTVLASLVMLVPGLWAWIAPASFAEATNWPNHVHFLHDAGIFQVSIGLMLLATLRWRDAPVVVLGGFVVANTLHTINHVTDLRLGGGSASDVLLGIFSLLAATALVLRLRQLRAARAERAAR